MELSTAAADYSILALREFFSRIICKKLFLVDYFFSPCITIYVVNKRILCHKKIDKIDILTKIKIAPFLQFGRMQNEISCNIEVGGQLKIE